MKRISLLAIAALGCIAILGAPASAESLRQGGKLLLTDGISSVEGSAGGGLATWGLVAGGATRDGIGATAHATVVALPDYTLTNFGAAVGFFDRVELSYVRQRFDTGKTGAKLGLGRGYAFDQDVFGAKVRVAGDAVYDQDRILPQITVGITHRRSKDRALATALGAKHGRDTDIYLAATKLLLSQSLLLNATARLTRANQFGLLGSGGDVQSKRRVQFEGSAAYMLSPGFVIGAEYRTKPDNLGFARENDAKDIFAALAIGRHLKATVAYVDLGSIATFKRQRGAFLSLQAGF